MFLKKLDFDKAEKKDVHFLILFSILFFHIAARFAVFAP